MAGHTAEDLRENQRRRQMTMMQLRQWTWRTALTIIVAACAAAHAQQAGAGLFDRFKQLDRNGDGKLSAEEFPGARFQQMDKDGDGFATMEEVRAFYAGRRTARPAAERPAPSQTTPTAPPKRHKRHGEILRQCFAAFPLAEVRIGWHGVSGPRRLTIRRLCRRLCVG
jgi:hypothetical protein